MRYTENDYKVLRAKEIGAAQFETMCNEASDNSKIYFVDGDITICNPFMDNTGRFEFTLEQAYEKYGEDNVNTFIEKCNGIDTECEIKWLDTGKIENVIIRSTEYNDDPDDDDIFYYGLSRAECFKAMTTGESVGDFKIISVK